MVIAEDVSVRLQPRSSVMGLRATAMVTLLTPDPKKPASMAMPTMIQP
jgi:hypothetical protein